MHANDTNYTLRAQEQLINSYLCEIREMHRATQMPVFLSILDHLQNYDKYLRGRRKAKAPMGVIAEASNGSRIINASKLSTALHEYYFTAHLAACCILNKDHTYSMSDLRDGKLMDEAQNYINNIASADEQRKRTVLQSINNMDAVRTIQLLKISGLITRQSSAMRQLGLGAAGGLKDIYYCHATPAISISKQHNIDTLHFDYQFQTVGDIIISDSDPRFEQNYRSYESDEKQSITGYINDTMSLLDNLATKNIQKRNLVTMLRIEPAMISDTIELLKGLAPLIDENCDFIFSIGAGDSLDAYQKRIDVTASLFDALNSAKLQPVLFQMHHGGTAIEQGQSLQFGSVGASSYEILYCKLNAKTLKKAFC